jgi:hypothetical protein
MAEQGQSDTRKPVLVTDATGRLFVAARTARRRPRTIDERAEALRDLGIDPVACDNSSSSKSTEAKYMVLGSYSAGSLRAESARSSAGGGKSRSGSRCPASRPSEMANEVRLCLRGPGYYVSQELAAIWVIGRKLGHPRMESAAHFHTREDAG